MKLTDPVPKWIEWPVKWSIYMVVIGGLLFVLGSRWLSENVGECMWQVVVFNPQNRSALEKVQAVDACLEEKNGLLENLLMYSTHKVLRALPNNPSMYVGVWTSSQPRCDYQIALKENGDFTAEPIKCNIGSNYFSGSWGVHENQMVWIDNRHIWPPDINPIDLVDSDFFLLTEADGTRTRFSRERNIAETTNMPSAQQPVTIAAPPTTDVANTAIALSWPVGIAADSSNLFVADSKDNAIHKIVIATGEMSTLAGSGTKGSDDGSGVAASFNNPMGIATDGINLYVADTGNSNIRKIDGATGVVTTLAGTGNNGSADGMGTAASFNNPVAITTDGNNLYVADTDNNAIRKIVIATGKVTTVAGKRTGGSIDAKGAAALFFHPAGIATDGVNLYVSDTGNNKIRKIVIATSEVTTVAGSGSVGALDGIGSAVSFNYPMGIITDGSSLYVADNLNNNVRKIVIATGAVSTLAGQGVAGLVDGAGTTAAFSSPAGITTYGGSLFVADTDNHKIRRIVIATGVVTSPAFLEIALTVTIPADTANATVSFKNPVGIATDGGNLYVADSMNNTIRKIGIASKAVTTLAGSGTKGSGDGTGTAASFNYPMGIVSDGSNLFVADTNNHTIRKIVTASSVVSTLAGSGANGSVDGTGTTATFNYPMSIATDGSNLYVADTDNNKIRKIVIATGVVTTLAGAGNKGASDGTGLAASFESPRGVTSDASNLYVADTGNNKIRKVVIATGMVTTLAGSGTRGSLDATAAAATFFMPSGIATDGSNLYVVDTNNHAIRKIVIASRAVTTLAGSGSTGRLDGMGKAASFNYPMGIAFVGNSLYVADNLNNQIRKIMITNGTVTTLAVSETQPFVAGSGEAASIDTPVVNTTNGENMNTDNRTIRKRKKAKKSKKAFAD